MTEVDWAAATDPNEMIAAVRVTGRATDRKLRLFAVACCRAAVPRLPTRRMRKVVDACERFADGAVDAAKLRAVWGDARWAANVASRRRDTPVAGVQWLTARLAEPDVTRVQLTARLAAALGDPWVQARVQVGLLHDIFGPLPFRSVAIEDQWLNWNHKTVPAIARHVYDDRAYHDLPILADALEDAGCVDRDILAHCRGGGDHVRGCWVVDLMLSRE